MNCKTTRKFLIAFADGQLSVQRNCEVLDHLKMCPACSAIVDGQQSLRRAIARSAARIVTPPGLEAKVRHAIATGDMARPGGGKQPGRPIRIGRTLALAACLVMGLTLVWRFFPGDSLQRARTGLAASGLAYVDDLTQRVVIQHNKCGKKCETQSHQHALLPEKLGDLEGAFGKLYGDRLAAAAPDLAGFGYEFESAGLCGPSPELTGPAAHVMYVNPTYGTRLSFFSVPHWPEIDLNGESPDRFNPFVHAFRGCDDNAMVAWHEGDATYVICGQVDAEAVADMIRDVKLAGR
ncbi:MAG TPA: zf-HC2 domain-containing protein [Phycisphaerae bacterium]|nr:zf-HC2 domain-containing protein [Phycisphaerae bacterium]